MYGIENYYAFILTGIILNITPGADTVYILTRSISQGQKVGVFSVLGIASGAFIHILLAVFGLSAILAKSIFLFTVVKWVGALYLLYIGMQMISNKSSLILNSNTVIKRDSLLKVYRQGLFTNLLNPKVALFFLSLLPQFIESSYINNPIPYLILGITFITTGTIWCLFLVLMASKISATLRAKAGISKWMQKISGTVFMGLGLQLLFTKQQ